MRTVLTLTLSLIRNQITRRWTMFVLVFAAVGILFFGSTLLSSWLIARPFLFLLYWGSCAWLTMAAVLLALFDICNLRIRAREMKQRLRGEVFGGEDSD